MADTTPFQITVAKNAGSCFGVNRALICVKEAAKNGPLCTLGPLIHNPRTVQELAERGARPISKDQIDALPRGSRIVLRAHGTAPQTERALAQKGFVLIDATCPFVKKAQEAAARFSENNLEVVITGEQDHPEIESLLGFAPGAHVVSNIDGAQELIDALLKENAETNNDHNGNDQDDSGSYVDTQCKDNQKDGMPNKNSLPRIGLLSQTTQSKEFFSQVEHAFRNAGFEIQRANTICEATKNRQDDAYKLAKEVDVMFVLGGRNSANTTRLAELCTQIVPTFHIESVAEITPNMLQELLQNARHIGITAGASTPQSQIQELVDYLNSYSKLNN